MRRDRPGDPNQLTFKWAVRTAENRKPEPPATSIASTASTARDRSPHEELRLPRRTWVSSRMPVPSPLSEAAAAGDFGLDESGKLIRPSREEVREITETHAERLRQNLIDGDTAAFEQGIVKYAESFGQPAADRLRRYVHRIAGEVLQTQPSRSR